MMSQTSEAPVTQVVAPVAPTSDEHLNDEQREFIARLKRLYKADHQAEYLYIQAEVDSLCIQLEQAKHLQQRPI